MKRKRTHGCNVWLTGFAFKFDQRICEMMDMAFATGAKK
jgi:hypothetical protein